MKKSTKFIAILTALLLLSPSLLITLSIETYAYGDPTAELETTIMQLFDERQAVIFEDEVDINHLNSIDYQLHQLGVEFLTYAEVQEQFPNEFSQDYDSHSSELAPLGIDPPSSSKNTWATYRFANQYYDGEYYNVQNLVAQPLTESSALWNEGQKQIYYSINWQAGATSFIKSIASVGASQLAPVTSTVYDVLSSTLQGLQPTSVVDPADVIYRWENRTTAVFSYVRLESESDNRQQLVYINSRCTTEIAYIADIDSWKVSSSSSLIPVPDLITGERTINSVPNYFNSVYYACVAYNNWVAGPVANQVTSINISGPESKSIVTIYPSTPQFPQQCEF